MGVIYNISDMILAVHGRQEKMGHGGLSNRDPNISTYALVFPFFPNISAWSFRKAASLISYQSASNVKTSAVQ
jgi:hypothetical protein